MNVRLRAYLDSHADDRRAGGQSTKRRFGIVAMDFPEAGAKDLVMSVVLTNFEQREAKKWRWRRWMLLWVLVALLMVCLLVCVLAWDPSWLRCGYSERLLCSTPTTRGYGAEILAEQ